MVQIPLSEAQPEADTGLGLTFRESKRLPFHRWYPYVEGFAADYVRDALRRFGPVKAVYDPFGGSGTCQLEASILGISSFYTEVNPFMCFVAEAKVNSALWARSHLEQVERLFSHYERQLASPAFQERVDSLSLDDYNRAFAGRDFFEEVHLRELLAARDLVNEVAGEHEHIRRLLLMVIAANIVRSSHMTRRADLRRRRPDEYKQRVVVVRAFLREKLKEVLGDLRSEIGPKVPMGRAGDNARALDLAGGPFDLALTSPPYLNGTNYFRNTKLELWFLGWLSSESELRNYRNLTVAGGINDVGGDREVRYRIPSADRVAEQLEATDGDRRIARLVRLYLSDMYEVFRSVHGALRPGGRFVLDIGDSKFYGVHVPTDSLLGDAAKEVGFTVEDMIVLARRRSYDKSELRQVELILKKTEPRSRRRGSGEAQHEQLPLASSAPRPGEDAPALVRSSRDALHQRIQHFAQELPHKHAPFNKRTWGHPLHSLCSYQGKLKPAIAHWLITEFTEPGSALLDPLGGIGTIPFEACLLGRRGISNDKSPLAYAVATGKVCAPEREEVSSAIERLTTALMKTQLAPEDMEQATFGLNGTVSDYYHPDTLAEVLRARRHFLALAKPTDADLFVKACLLHVLHGNRPYAISRTSHPITPFHPQGPAVYKSVLGHVRARADAVLKGGLPAGFQSGLSLHGDFRSIPSSVSHVDAIVTSPPFLGMRFDRPNWLRLWFCGWSAESFHTVSRGFLERQQTQTLDVYQEFYATCAELLGVGGLCILHLGGSDRHQMVRRLAELAAERFDVVDVVAEDVSEVERHGITDKGMTTSHNYIFMLRR